MDCFWKTLLWLTLLIPITLIILGIIAAHEESKYSYAKYLDMGMDETGALIRAVFPHAFWILVTIITIIYALNH